jgi:GAF domain-containing protein
VADHADRTLVELELAAELDPRAAPPQEPTSAREDTADRDRKLLRAVYTELPLPVFLLERDGVVRRANRAACGLLDVAAAYPTGKPFPLFLDLPGRAPFRAQLSAAVRAGAVRLCPTPVLRRGRPVTTVLRLAPIRLPGEPEPLVTVVALPRGETAAPPAPPTAAPDPVGAARRLDLMAAMSRLLLGSGPAAEEETTLGRAAGLLAAELADWVVVDLATSPAAAPGLARHLVVGPDRLLAERVRSVPPGRRALPGRAATTRRSVLAPAARPVELGRLPDGEPVGAALGVGSALSVPLLVPDGPLTAGPVADQLAATAPAVGGGMLGVVTLARRDGRRAFELADVGLLEHLGEHLALALRAARSGPARDTRLRTLTEDADPAGADEQADDDQHDAEQQRAADDVDDAGDHEHDGDDPQDEIHADPLPERLTVQTGQSVTGCDAPLSTAGR